MKQLGFQILKKDNKTRARRGVLYTSHGKIYTPAYVMVATHAQIKCLEPSDIKKTKTQVVIANTYHLWPSATKLKVKSEKSKVKNEGFIIKKLGVSLPTMTDSGGFQVFSFGAAKEHGVGKISGKSDKEQAIRDGQIRITEKGVYFTLDGQKRFLGPELSIQIQEKLGADIIFAFDECTSPLHDLKYNKAAMERTHRWAKECLKAKTRKDQLLFGIVQGGVYQSLRRQSAKFIGSLPFDGFGIGGSFGEKEMVQTLKTIIPYLPEDKPRHLLGIGRIEDVFNAVENGVDLFDCVIPTREARHGRIWTNKGAYDIRKGKYRTSRSNIEPGCACPACKKITRAELHRLFKTKQPLAGRYATIHNVWFFNSFLERIRASIKQGNFLKFKQKFLSRLQA
ncbi:MAG: tRNA guanosine(34) transglycosylase Tgt [Candidatus Yanofskybacteria bacterium]|nr:tRNA guanosine(34) transglycosylase Tgt [Candidatus Yanofskybacteria bacterium]